LYVIYSLFQKNSECCFFLKTHQELCHSLRKKRDLQPRVTCTKPWQAGGAKGKGKGKNPSAKQKPKTTPQNNQQNRENNQKSPKYTPEASTWKQPTPGSHHPKHQQPEEADIHTKPSWNTLRLHGTWGRSEHPPESVHHVGLPPPKITAEPK
jgi:hypothetical protein